MKKITAVFAFVVFACAVHSTPTIAQQNEEAADTQSEDSNEKRLREFRAKIKAELDATLKNLASTDSLSLFRACGPALDARRFEDAGVLFYVAQVRAAVDAKVFPPIGKGANSPLVAVSAIKDQLGSVINPILLRQPEVYSRTLARVRKIKLEFVEGYDPGWKCTKPDDANERREIESKAMGSFLDAMGTFEKLLKNKEYFEIFKQRQDARLSVELLRAIEGPGFEPVRLTEDELEPGMIRGAEIEREMGFESGPITLALRKKRERNRLKELSKEKKTARKSSNRIWRRATFRFVKRSQLLKAIEKAIGQQFPFENDI